MTTYDIIYDAMLLDEALGKHGMSRNYEIFDGDDGYVSFLEEKVNELEKYWEEITKDGSYLYSIYEATEEFVNKNAERWEREIRGEKVFKVRMVIEVDTTDMRIEDVGSNVASYVESIVSNEYNIYDGGMPCKVIDIQSVEEVNE